MDYSYKFNHKYPSNNISLVNNINTNKQIKTNYLSKLKQKVKNIRQLTPDIINRRINSNILSKNSKIKNGLNLRRSATPERNVSKLRSGIKPKINLNKDEFNIRFYESQNSGNKLLRINSNFINNPKSRSPNIKTSNRRRIYTPDSKPNKLTASKLSTSSIRTQSKIRSKTPSRKGTVFTKYIKNRSPSPLYRNNSNNLAGNSSHYLSYSRKNKRNNSNISNISNISDCSASKQYQINNIGSSSHYLIKNRSSNVSSNFNNFINGPITDPLVTTANISNTNNINFKPNKYLSTTFNNKPNYNNINLNNYAFDLNKIGLKTNFTNFDIGTYHYKKSPSKIESQNARKIAGNDSNFENNIKKNYSSYCFDTAPNAQNFGSKFAPNNSMNSFQNSTSYYNNSTSNCRMNLTGVEFGGKNVQRDSGYNGYLTKKSPYSTSSHLNGPTKSSTTNTFTTNNTNDDISYSNISRTNKSMETIEEVHFNFVGILQGSKKMVNLQENYCNDKIIANNPGSTVVWIEEKDL